MESSDDVLNIRGSWEISLGPSNKPFVPEFKELDEKCRQKIYNQLNSLDCEKENIIYDKFEKIFALVSFTSFIVSLLYLFLPFFLIH